jgi:hypothetical protein
MQPTKLEIAHSISLPKIQVQFNENDKPEAYAAFAGLSFPVIQVGSTVLNSQDVSSCVYRIGHSNLPTLLLTFIDPKSSFRENDIIDTSTTIVMYIGSNAVNEFAGIKINNKQVFRITNITSSNGYINIDGELKVPTNRFDLLADNFENILRELCKQSGLGLRYNHAIVHKHTGNLMQVTALEAINVLADMHGFSWFIDNHYNLVILESLNTVKEHTKNTIDYNITTGAPLEKQPVVLNNSLSGESQFRFSNRSYAVIDVDNTEIEYQAPEFDISADIDLSKTIVAEGSVTKLAKRYDYDAVFLQMPYNPIVLSGHTYDLAVYTTPNSTKRLTDTEVTNGAKKTMQQQLIEDFSGVYFVKNWEYRFLKYKQPELWFDLLKPIQQ